MQVFVFVDVERSSGSAVCDGLRKADCLHGVGGVGIRPDGGGIVCGEHRSAHDDIGLGCGGTQGADGFLHGRNGGGHQCREAHNGGVQAGDGLHNGLGRNVTAKVGDGVAVVLKQEADNVLADVVNVALDGCKDNV